MKKFRQQFARVSSLLLVLVAVTGIVGFGGERTVAAAGRIDMAGLLDMILGEQEGEGLRVFSRDDGRRILTPVESPGVHTPQVLLPLEAVGVPGSAEHVSFGVNELGEEAFPAPNFWEGQAFSGPSAADGGPLSGLLNLAPLLNGIINAERTLFLYGFTGLTAKSLEAAGQLYDEASDPLEAPRVQLEELSPLFDLHLNGIPDYPFNLLGPGDTWITEVDTGAGRKTVLVANLAAWNDAVAPTLSFVPVEGITVSVPSTEALQEAGFVAAGETCLVLIQVADELAALLDEVDGVEDDAARTLWAESVISEAPGAVVQRFLHVSLLYTVGDLAFEELEDLSGSGLAIGARMDAPVPGKRVQVFAYPVRVATRSVGDEVVVMTSPEPQEWRRAGVQASSFTSLQSAVFAMIQAGVELDTVVPAQVAQGVETLFALHGSFGVASGMSVAEAAAAYRIYIGGATPTATDLAPFRAGPEGHAISAGKEGANTAYVAHATQAAPGSTLHVHVYELNDPASFGVLANAVRVLGAEHDGGVAPVGEGEAAEEGEREGDAVAEIEKAPAQIAGISLGAVPAAQVDVYAFGGVVARLTGTELSVETEITVGAGAAARAVSPLRAAADGSTLDFVVPPAGDGGDADSVLADVTVRNGETAPAVLPAAIRYLRHRELEGTRVSAFHFTGDAGTRIEIQLLGAGAEAGQVALDIPALPGVNPGEEVFALFLAREVGADKATGIGPVPATALIAAGEPIDGSLDFSLHLYRQDGAAPEVGEAAYTEAPLLNFARTLAAGSQNPQQQGAIRLSFPVAAANLTAADVRKGLTVWGIRSAFDYLADETLVELNQPRVQYQSQVRAAQNVPGTPAEVSPVVPVAAADAMVIENIVQARLYTMNSFSLRRNAPLPEEVSSQIRIGTDTGTTNGPTSGGTLVRIVSPLGGLAWVDRVEFRDPDTGAVTAEQRSLVTPRGSNEYELVIAAPATSQGGVKNLSIFTSTAPDLPTVTLQRAFEYRQRATPDMLLVLLGLGIALIGLFAGGNSSGSGGGPCFIATAAYGTPLSGEIDVLREVRDQFLLTNPVGTAFVDAYYHVSPAVAEAVAANPVLKVAVQIVLTPLVLLAQWFLVAPWPLLGMTLLLAGCWRTMRAQRRRRRAPRA